MRSSSRPSISEMSLNGGRSAVAADPDKAAIAQDRDAIADLVDLVDEMGDEDDRKPSAFELAHDAEKEFGLFRVEARGRLVEDEDPRVLFERARDRHQLLNGDRIGAEGTFDVDVDAEPLEPFLGAFARLAPRDQAEPARLPAERQVLRHRHRRDEIDFLVDRADAERARLPRSVDLDGVAVQANFALVPAQGAGHDLDQRRLAGAVLAHQRMDLAGIDPEIDAVERANARKGLGDADHLDSRRGGFAHLATFVWTCFGRRRHETPAPADASASRVQTEAVRRRRAKGSAARQLAGVAAVCRSEGITIHLGRSFLSFR